MLENTRMQEEKLVKTYIESITKIIIGIKGCGGTILEDEVCYKILRSLTHAYDTKVITIEEVVPIMPYFNRGTLIGRLLEFESILKPNLPRSETTFKSSVDKYKILLTKSVSTSGDYVGEWAEMKEEEKKIDEVVSSIVKREPKGKKDFYYLNYK